MKKMLLVLALLVAVVAAVPWVAGVWVEQELRDKLQWEPDSATPDVNVVWEEYQRGYLNSTAKLRFDMGGVVHHYLLKIHHAPLIRILPASPFRIWMMPCRMAKCVLTGNGNYSGNSRYRNFGKAMCILQAAKLQEAARKPIFR